MQRTEIQCLTSTWWLTEAATPIPRDPESFSGLYGHWACMQYICIHVSKHSCQSKNRSIFLKCVDTKRAGAHRDLCDQTIGLETHRATGPWRAFWNRWGHRRATRGTSKYSVKNHCTQFLERHAGSGYDWDLTCGTLKQRTETDLTRVYSGRCEWEFLSTLVLLR